MKAFLLPNDRIGIPDDFTMKMKVMEIRFEGLGSNIHLKLQTRTMTTANWYTTSPPARERSQLRSGVRSARGEASLVPDDRERRDVHTLRTSTTILKCGRRLKSTPTVAYDNSSSSSDTIGVLDVITIKLNIKVIVKVGSAREKLQKLKEA
ncbi:hypothetical protein ACLB2K_016592 [Fragaria x ananassa]